MGEGTKLLTGTVRRWRNGEIAISARNRGDDDEPSGEERYLLEHVYDSGDQPDAECLVIIADDPDELRRVREMLEGGRR